MDLRDKLANPASIRYIDKLVLEVYEQPDTFPILFQLIFDADMKVAWKAAWVCDKISEKTPDWFSSSHFDQLCKLLLQTNHSGLQRGCLSTLLNLPLPEEISVDFINFCFESMISPKSAIAVQALSMKMLLRISQKEPDFALELKAYLENIDVNCYSAGFIATRKNTLKVLNKMKLGEGVDK